MEMLSDFLTDLSKSVLNRMRLSTNLANIMVAFSGQVNLDSYKSVISRQKANIVWNHLLWVLERGREMYSELPHATELLIIF